MKSWAIWFYTHVRSAVGIVMMVIFTMMTSIVAILVSFARPIETVTRVIRTWGHTVLGAFGIRVQVTGEENLPQAGGGIIVFNHQSLFDIPCLVAATSKHIRFGAKIELFKIPIFGPAMRHVGTLPIARDNRSEVMRIYKEAGVRFRENVIFVLAPEGTRQREPVLGRFKKGPFIFAINAKVPIIPAVIKGAHPVLPKNTLSINVGRLRRTVHVQFLPQVSTENAGAEKIDIFVGRVRESMVAAYEAMPADVR